MNMLITRLRQLIARHIDNANYKSALEQQQGQRGYIGPYSLLINPGASQRD